MEIKYEERDESLSKQKNRYRQLSITVFRIKNSKIALLLDNL